MRNFLLIVLTLLVTTNVFAGGKKVKFKKGTLEKIQKIAKKKNKIIFIDFYADWCGPCKRMDKDVLSQKEVINFFNSNFVNYKLNVDGKYAFIHKINYEVDSLPTYVWIKPNGEVIVKYKGTCSKRIFMSQARTAVAKFKTK